MRTAFDRENFPKFLKLATPRGLGKTVSHFPRSFFASNTRKTANRIWAGLARIARIDNNLCGREMYRST